MNGAKSILCRPETGPHQVQQVVRLGVVICVVSIWSKLVACVVHVLEGPTVILSHSQGHMYRCSAF